jgi:hypothetical protein
MRFTNTHLLSPAANYFQKNGVYTTLTRNTKEWERFWEEEKRRCIEGYEAGGIKITGYHYFYLNYFRIDRSVEKEIRGRKYKKKEFLQPRFYDGDYEFFWLVDIARYGISKKEYEELKLDVDIHRDDLKGGKNLIVLKARRKGYSYKNASMLTRNYYFMKDSNNVVYASDKQFLEGDGMYQKFLDAMSFIDTNTAFIQPRLIDRPAQMVMKSGYFEVENGTNIAKGIKSLVEGVSLKDNPNKVRGGDKELALLEEMGKFPGLKTAFDILYHTAKEGDEVLGIIIAFGTGGTEGADFQGAEELFFNPEENGCIRVNNKWDEGADGTWCGYFVPVYMNLPGFMDEHGNSLIEESIAYEETQRDIKKRSKVSNSYSQHVAELPFNPREAVLSVDLNLFPTQELAAQRNSVIAERRYDAGTPGIMTQTDDGVKFRVSADVKPIYKFPHTKQDVVDGAVVLYEPPQRVNGYVPKDLYILCHDPYGQDTTAETSVGSLGAAFIIKRINDFSPTMNECIVASYVGRPESQDEYNRNMFMLAEYYNAKIGFENDRGDVYGFAKRYKKLHMLEEQFSFLDKKELQGRTRRPYGMNMTQKRKEQAEIYVRDWLLTPITKYDDGTETLILNTITDPALLEELIKYHKKGNFDRVSALFIGMYHLKEKFNQEVKAIRQSQHEEFFNRIYHEQ